MFPGEGNNNPLCNEARKNHSRCTPLTTTWSNYLPTTHKAAGPITIY